MSKGGTSKRFVDTIGSPRSIPYDDITPVAGAAVLGTGAFGVVNAVKVEGERSRMAFKEMKKAGGNLDEQMKQLQALNNEQKLHYHCSQSAHVVKLLYVCSDPQGMVLELMLGGTLTARLNDKQDFPVLTLRVTLGFVKDMFEALHFLRQRRPPIAHADVKPDNLLIDERGVLKLTDFGSARVSTPLEDAKADSEERGPGSLLYMSPARLTGSACRCSDDMYSAGVLIGEIVSRCPQESFGTVLALNDENGFTDAVVNGGKRPLDYSPVRESLLLNTDLCALAQYCWNADRRKRPAPSAVLDSLDLYINKAKEDEDAEAAAAAASAAAGGGGGRGGSPPALRRQHTYSQQQQRKQIAESFDHFDTGEFKVGGGRQIAAEAGFKTLESRKPTRCFSFTLSCTHANQRPLFFHPLFLF